MTQTRLSRVTGCEPLKISRGVRRVIASAFLSVPFALIATAMADSALVSDTFRYVFSPGTLFALRFVKVEGSHRGLGVFLDALSVYSAMMVVALLVNAVFYGLLIFGFAQIRLHFTGPEPNCANEPCAKK
jgi:hypothetical protein